MIPKVDAAAIREAMDAFDADLRSSTEWHGWEDNKAHKYAINADDRRYPVKQIVSLATGMPVSEFSGGEGSGQANEFVRELGFEVVPLRGRNPKWTRDELILALDFYLRHRPNPPGKESADIAALSTTLNRLAVALGVPHDATYRNPNGVYMKLMNFRRLDPEYTAEGRVGLSRGGKDEEVVWTEFALDPARCARAADAIRAGIERIHGTPSSLPEDDLDDGTEAAEGRLLTVLHRRRERNPQIIAKKKRTVLSQQGHLACTVCGFDFARTYGERGEGFIECHHTKPVSESTGGRTSLADLALVCSNCHRMIHARRPWLTIDQLRALLR